DLPKELEVGTTILIDDGLIELTVEEITSYDIHCQVKNGGILKSKKGVNIPGVKINLPGITQKDAENILFGIEHEVDFIAASFVIKQDHILEIRNILEKYQSKWFIHVKIVNQRCRENLSSILKVAYGITIARGDMGVMIPVEEVPI